MLFFFILTTWFIVESGEYELIAFCFLVRCYEQLWCSILGLRYGSNHDKRRFGACLIPKRKVVYLQSRWSDQAALLAPAYMQWHRVMRQYEHGTPYSNPETEGLGLTANTHLHA